MEEWRGRELLSLESSPGFCLPSCWAERGTKGCRAFRRWGLTGGSGSLGGVPLKLHPLLIPVWFPLLPACSLVNRLCLVFLPLDSWPLLAAPSLLY